MTLLPEGVATYPRWKGALRAGPSFPVIAAQEWRRAYANTWSLTALVLVFAYVVIYLGNLHTLAAQRGDAASHTMDNFLYFLGNLRWGALGIAAIMAGPALLEDARRGALELYMARGLTRADYLAGKVLAVFGLTSVAVIGPGLLYWAFSFFLFKEQPQHWWTVPGGVIIYGLLWSALVSGLGLGLSCVSRSARGATVILFGGFAIADVFVSSLLSSITRNDALQILSPFSALQQNVEWLFQATAPFHFPSWWGLVEVIVLAALGWALVAWKHPRLGGA